MERERVVRVLGEVKRMRSFGKGMNFLFWSSMTQLGGWSVGGLGVGRERMENGLKC